MNAIRRILLSLAVTCAAALVGGWGLALAAVSTLVLSQLVMALVGRHLSDGGKLAAAIILGLGFGFSSVMAASALLPMLPIGPLVAGSVFLQQGYAGILLLAILSALVQAVVGGWKLPLHLGAAQPPKAFQGLPILLLTAALAIMALTGFAGLRIG